MPTPATLLPALGAVLLAACSNGAGGPTRGGAAPDDDVTAMADSTTPGGETAAVRPQAPSETELATFGAGCFWCVEAVLEQLDGVLGVTSGYMGGDVPDPSYQQVCSGRTGHAEVVQVRFDPSVISYEELLAWFWKLHDPTQLNRQGADVGTQYRSAIFVHSDAQRETAEASKAAAAPEFVRPIVTEITEAGPFYEAEDYHQDYYRQNKSEGYCRMVIAPKLDKLGLEE